MHTIFASEALDSERQNHMSRFTWLTISRSGTPSESLDQIWDGLKEDRYEYTRAEQGSWKQDIVHCGHHSSLYSSVAGANSVACKIHNSIPWRHEIWKKAMWFSLKKPML